MVCLQGNEFPITRRERAEGNGQITEMIWRQFKYEFRIRLGRFLNMCQVGGPAVLSLWKK